MPGPAPNPNPPKPGPTDELFKRLGALEGKVASLEKTITATNNLVQTTETLVQTTDGLVQRIAEIERTITTNAQAITTNAQAINDLGSQISHVKKTAVSSIGHFLGKIPEGLKTTMTQKQHNLHVIAGALQVIFLLVSFVLFFVPNLGTASVISGVTLAALISGIKNIVNPFLANYGDAEIPTEFTPGTTPEGHSPT